MLDLTLLHSSGLVVGMPVLPEDKSLVVLAGDGYVGGTAFALIVCKEPSLSPNAEPERWQKHDCAQARAALKIKWIAMTIGLALTLIWLLGNRSAYGSGYHFLPSDRSLFAAIPLFGIADMLTAAIVFLAIKLPDDYDEAHAEQLVRRREVGDTMGQLFSTCLASVYLGFWLSLFVLSK